MNRYLRFTRPEIFQSPPPKGIAMKLFKAKLVSIVSRGVDITPAERVERFDNTRLKHRLDKIAQPVDYEIYESNPISNRIDWLDWAVIVFIVLCLILSIVLLWLLESDPIAAGDLMSGICQFPDYCQIARWID